MSDSNREEPKLPLWRLLAAILVIAGMAGVLLALSPVYFEDFELRQYIRAMVRRSNAAAAPDEQVRSAVLARARQLELPVEPGDIQIAHPGGKLRVEMKYQVQMDFPLYQVDLHFHPSATGP